MPLVGTCEIGGPVCRAGASSDATFEAAWERVGRRGELAELESKRYWREEIDSVIKGRGLAHVGDYEALTRPGRAVRLGGRARHAVWRLMEAYSDELESRGVHDHNDLLTAAVNLVRPHPDLRRVLGPW